MKVSELISILQKMNQDATVEVEYQGTGGYKIYDLEKKVVISV